MRTFRAERHIESVECVTAQVRRSQSRGGGTKGSPFVVDDLEGSATYLDGARMLMVLDGFVAGGAGIGSAIVSVLLYRSYRVFL